MRLSDQASREFLQLYPTARILVADETYFVKEKRARFLARAATANWDAIIITHSAFRFIAVPSAFEQRLIEDQIAMHEAVKLRADADDRTTRKRIEAMKEKLEERLQALKTRRNSLICTTPRRRCRRSVLSKSGGADGAFGKDNSPSASSPASASPPSTAISTRFVHAGPDGVRPSARRWNSSTSTTTSVPALACMTRCSSRPIARTDPAATRAGFRVDGVARRQRRLSVK